MYKALLFDVDKTLTDSHKQINERTIKAIQIARESGSLVGVCTGRCLATISGMLELVFDPSDLHVVAGGGQVIRNSGEVMFERLVSDATVRKIVKLGEENHCRILVQKAKEMYGNEKARSHKSVNFLSGQKEVIVRDLGELTDFSVPLISVLEINDGFVEGLKDLAVSYKILTNYDGKKYTDITAQGVTKVVGLEKWCELQNIKENDVVGFGDGANDLEFLQAVGHSVAMGNAIEEIKTICDEVVDDCDHDGVAKWIQNAYAE